MMNIKKVLVMMTLLKTFQIINMCPILSMVFHTNITTYWEVKYWLHDYSRSGYMMSVDYKIYSHAKVSFLYIYVNYHVIFL